MMNKNINCENPKICRVKEMCLLYILLIMIISQFNLFLINRKDSLAWYFGPQSCLFNCD